MRSWRSGCRTLFQWVRGVVGIEGVARTAGFLALPDLEAQWGCGEVGAERTVVLDEEGRAAVRTATAGQGRPEVGHQQVCVRDHEASARAQDTYELRPYGGQIGDVHQGEGADDGVDRVVGKR